MAEQHGIQLRKYGTDEFITVPGKGDPAEKPALRHYSDVLAEREQAAPQPSLMRRIGKWLQEHAPGAAMAATPKQVPAPRDVIFLRNYETHEMMAVAVKPQHESKPVLRNYTDVLAERAVAHQEPSSMKKLGEWLETNAPDAPAATPGKSASKPLRQFRT